MLPHLAYQLVQRGGRDALVHAGIQVSGDLQKIFHGKTGLSGHEGDGRVRKKEQLLAYRRKVAFAKILFVLVSGQGVLAKTFQSQVPFVYQNRKSTPGIQCVTSQNLILFRNPLSGIKNKKDHIHFINGMLGANG